MPDKNTNLNNIELPQGFSLEQAELIKAAIAKDATDEEFRLFLYTSQRTGLDPLTKQIHLVRKKVKQAEGSFKTVMTIQTGIDGYRAIADRTGQLAGIDDPVYDTEEALSPKKATVTVYKMINHQRCPFTATARWKEYYPGETHGFMWSKMPYLMLGKCAEALALRKAFPNDLSGIYTNEEMHQADDDEKVYESSSTEEKSVDSKVISEPQRKRLYALANGDAELLKDIATKYGYASSRDIKINDYETISNEIKESAAQVH